MNDKRLLDASEVCYYLSLGRNRGIEFAKSIGAEVKVGRRCLYDRVKLDQYLNELTEA
ncbi:MAG: polyprenyl synthetase solanesyl diphosphate synthase [Paenibacillaceae bacterium]|nr:polyprenyl synthetase solanesyl diphosphate synthase [Paenibacillaceae bacterium]